MIEIQNSETLQRWLLESGHLGRLWDRPRFLFDRAEFDREVAGVREQYPRFAADEAEARAALRLLGKEEARSRTHSSPAKAEDRSHWTRRERLFLAAVLVLAALVALLLCAPRAHAQSRSFGMQPAAHGDYVLGRPRPWDAQGQPAGIIIQVQNQGSTILTRPAGLLVLNFSTNLSASASANTITVTATGGSGSGCIPPGSTSNALLFDAGSGTCSDVAKVTWNNGSSTLTGTSGLTVDFSAASALKLSGANTSGLPGTTGQLLYNNGGNLGAEDPVVSGPDARAAAQSKNPVAGLAGIDYTTNCSIGPCVQEAKVDSSGNVYVDVTNTPTVSVSGTVPVSGTFWQATQPVSIASMPTTPVTGTFWQATQPVSWSGQSVSLTGSWPFSGTLGAVTQASGPWTVNLTQVDSTALGAPSNYGTSPGAVAVMGVNAYVTNTVPVSGTFWQTTQPVSCASGATCPVNATIQGTPTVEIEDGSGNKYLADPCQQLAGSSANINLTASGQIITGTSGEQTYICGMDIVTATAQNIALVEGTGTTCATSTAGMAGGTTAATGWNFAANGGLVKGAGGHWVYKTATAADNVCLLLSGTGQTSGAVRYVQQ